MKQRRETYIEPVVPAQLDLVLFFPLIDLFMVPVWNTSISCEKLRRRCLDSPDCVLYQDWLPKERAAAVCVIFPPAPTTQAAIVCLKTMFLGCLVIHSMAHQKYQHGVHFTIGALDIHFAAK